MNDRWNESWDSDEFSDADSDEYDESPDDELIRCPECHDWIHEESVSCPSCGHYILEVSRHASSRSPQSRRLFVTVVVVVIAALLLPFLVGLVAMLRAVAE